MANQYSVSDLGTRAPAIVAEARTSKEPVFVSQNGHAAVVVVDADTYINEMQALKEFERIFRDESSIRPSRLDENVEPVMPPKYTWRCKVCGFTIEADELPEGFVCPKCGVGKDQFERVEL